MSENDFDVDRLRQAFASLRESARPGDACPDAERLWSAARGELPAEATRTLLDHTISCGACAESWQLAHELASGLASVPGRPARPTWISWSGIAAGLAAALALSAVLRTQQEPQEPARYRDGRTPAIRALTNETALPRASCVLRWSTVAPDARYDVHVATRDLKTLSAARDLSATEYRVPESALQGLAPGATLLWQVEARLPGGRRVASPTFLVRIQ